MLPMIQGFVGQLDDVVFSKGSQWAMASLTLIARRSIYRIGTRHWRRGADKEVTTNSRILLSVNRFVAMFSMMLKLSVVGDMLALSLRY